MKETPAEHPRILRWKNRLQDQDDTEPDADCDYLWCPACRIHVPCFRVPSGGWEVRCQGCAGECVICDCHLKRFCFGNRDQFPPRDA